MRKSQKMKYQIAIPYTISMAFTWHWIILSNGHISRKVSGIFSTECAVLGIFSLGGMSVDNASSIYKSWHPCYVQVEHAG